MDDVHPDILIEAIHSVALSHDEDCGCDLCKAADGDGVAFTRVLNAVGSFSRRGTRPD